MEQQVMVDRIRPRPELRFPKAEITCLAVANAYRDLAVHVRELRSKYGLSQNDLAMRMLTNERAIRRIEKADHNVTIETLVRLADALDVPVRLLLTPVREPIDAALRPDSDGRNARAVLRRRKQAL